MPSPASRRTPDQRFDEASRFARDILPAVSRTFALSIRVLPSTLGQAVNCAYLLCRIADTIEDEPEMAADAKALLFDRFLACFDDAARADAFPALTAAMRGDAAHLRLIHHADLVFTVFRQLPLATQAHVRRWVTEMTTGMRKFVLLYPHGIRIQSLEEYREYCYYVAGTVGYMLTDLWREHAPSIPPARYEQLRQRSRSFGEALQTVNILKDISQDAVRENAIYVPQQLLAEYGGGHDAILAGDQSGATRAAMAGLVALAWDDLEHAKDYLLLIPRRAVSIRLFCALPLLFAYATLRDLTRPPTGHAPGGVIKISRAEVKSLTLLSIVGVMSNRMLAWLARRASSRPILIVPSFASGR